MCPFAIGFGMIAGAFVGGQVGPPTTITLPRISIRTGDDPGPQSTPSATPTPAPTVRPVPKPTRDESPVAIYRNVIDPEFTSIATTHKWSCEGNSLEGKWFALTKPDADTWGKRLNGDSGITFTTNIPRWVYDQLLHRSMLDGIGPAAYATPAQLDLINRTMDGIRIA